MKHIKIFKDFLFETSQLADKVYFKTGELSENDRKLVWSVTQGDNYTNFVAGVLFHFKKGLKEVCTKETLELYYKEVKNYNKNVFPIKEYDINNHTENISSFYSALLERKKIIDKFYKLPSIAIRNMKNDIKTPRNYSELLNYWNHLEYFMAQFSLLDNRDPAERQHIHNKMFKNNVTLDKLINFADEKHNLIGGKDFTKEDIEELVSDSDMYIIYEKNDIMVILVDDPNDMKKLGCISLWCFTYGGRNHDWRTWNTYSTNAIVYVIVDFRYKNTPDFMNVVIKPIKFNIGADDEEEVNDEKIYDLTNSPQCSPLSYLEDTLGLRLAKKLLTFKHKEI